MLILIAVTSFLAVALGLAALANRLPNPIEGRLQRLAQPGAPSPFSGLAEGHHVSSLALPAVTGLQRLLPDRWLARLGRMTVAAGDRFDPGLFLLFWVLFAVCAAVAGFMIFQVRGILYFGAVGALGPFLWLRHSVNSRRRRISAGLVDAVDLLVACVETGLGLDAALMQVADVTEGPLGEEMQLALRRMALGQPRQEALMEIGDRTGVRDLDAFLRPIIQAERAGVSIGAALRVQADGLRQRRHQEARAFVEKMPAKMVIPMALFFLPAVLIVGVGSAILSVIKTFGGLGG